MWVAKYGQVEILKNNENRLNRPWPVNTNWNTVESSLFKKFEINRTIEKNCSGDFPNKLFSKNENVDKFIYDSVSKSWMFQKMNFQLVQNVFQKSLCNWDNGRKETEWIISTSLLNVGSMSLFNIWRLIVEFQFFVFKTIGFFCFYPNLFKDIYFINSVWLYH